MFAPWSPSANAPSNALCRKFGFVLTGDGKFQFRDRTLRCNHWELDVQVAGQHENPAYARFSCE